ncbi:MAG: hypothetical protein LKE51_13855 [Selenomonas sp.]|nr:hypothetical protein [Selenomonas sp.]
MSGSGPTVFGLVESRGTANKIAGLPAGIDESGCVCHAYDEHVLLIQ